MEEEGQSSFEKRGEGDLHFGCFDASLDWRYDDSLDHVDFNFVGSDEGTEVSGRGWAKMEGKQMIGQALFHQGEESGFKAKKGR